MKRYLILILFLISTLLAFATPPNLACEAIFERGDLRRPGIDLCIKKQPNNYYRGIIVKKDPKLLAEIEKLIEQDSKVATEVIYRNDEEGTGSGVVLLVSNNGHTINIGLSKKENGEFGFFIQSVLAAFE